MNYLSLNDTEWDILANPQAKISEETSNAQSHADWDESDEINNCIIVNKWKRNKKKRFTKL